MNVKHKEYLYLTSRRKELRSNIIEHICTAVLVAFFLSTIVLGAVLDHSFSL